MNKKLAELTVRKSADYYNKVVKALEAAGFVLVLDCETSTDRYYIVAEDEKTTEIAINAVEQELKTGNLVHGEYGSECCCDDPAYTIDYKFRLTETNTL